MRARPERPTLDRMPFDPISKPEVLALVLLGLAPLGCSDPAPPASAPERSSAVAAPTAPAEPSAEEVARTAQAERLRAWLRTQTVSMDELLRDRPIVYTWTRAEQIEELRAHPQLLTRTRAPNGERTAFDASLDGDAHPVARHLSAHPFARRYAWTNPWATRRGWPGGDYGDRLIAIELRADAWFATFDTTASDPDRWHVRTLTGEAVSADEVASDPARVAAILHVGRGVGPSGETRVFREIVVVSEPWIKRYSVGTSDLAARLAADGAQLTELASYLAEEPAPDPSAWVGALLPRWTTATPDEASVIELYDRALAMGSTEVLPDAAHLRTLAESLTMAREPELVHEVVRTAPRRPPPPVVQPLPNGGPWVT